MTAQKEKFKQEEMDRMSATYEASKKQKVLTKKKSSACV